MKKITSVSHEERITIAFLARRGKNSAEIRELVRKPTEVIRRVCRRDGVSLVPVYEARSLPAKEPPAIEAAKPPEEPVCPLASAGEGLKPFERAVAILKHLGRHSHLMQGDYTVHMLDGKAATPYRFVTEANRALQARGLPLIDAPWG